MVRSIPGPLALAVLLLLAPARGAARTFTVAPPPGWVEPIAAATADPAAAEVPGGVEYLAVDDQIRAGSGGPEHFRRLVYRVRSPKGIEDAAELRVTFDPAYQRLVLHAAAIQRGATRIDALRAGDVRILQRETDLDRRLYDGRLTAVLNLRDVRVGDVVETAYTVLGGNPVFGGRFADSFSLAFSVPVARLDVRVLLPDGRPLAWRAHGLELPPSVRTVAGLVEHRWHREGVAPVAGESDLPPGFTVFPWLEVSEWASWADVVRWALPLYAPGGPSNGMAARIEAWRALPGEEARATAALRFVQDEVRYLGMELGEGSHRPRRAAEVFEARFGDCKDKSLLLVAIYRALGIEATPALVNTEDRGAIASRLPSPLAFDHVVVRARVAGAERWLEPTRSLEHAPVGAVVPPPYEQGLPIAAGVGGLAALPQPNASRVAARSLWRTSRPGEPVRFEVVTRYEGMSALGLRHALAEGSPAALQRRYLDHYGHDDPQIRAVGPLEILDEPEAERLTVTERYELPPFEPGAVRDFRADAIRERLDDPANVLRKAPLRVPHPALVSEELRLEVPGADSIESGQQVLTSPAARLTRTVRAEGSALVVGFEYRSVAPAVEPGAMAEHLEALRRMREASWISVAVGGGGPARDAKSGGGRVAGAIVGIFLVIGALALVARFDLRGWWTERRQARRRRAFASKQVLAPGESPHVPIRVRTAEEIARRLSGQRCTCGAPLAGPAGEGERLLFGGGELIVHALACDRCGFQRQTYFGVSR